MGLLTIFVIPPRTKGRLFQDEVAAIPDDNKFKVTYKTGDTISTVYDNACNLWCDDLGMQEEAYLMPFSKVTGLDGAKLSRDTPMTEVFPPGTPLADQILCFQQQWANKHEHRLAKTSKFKFSNDNKREADEPAGDEHREIKRLKKHLKQDRCENAEGPVPCSEMPARHLAIPTPRRSSQLQGKIVPSTNFLELPASQMPPPSSQVNPSRLPPPTVIASSGVEVQPKPLAAEDVAATQSTVNSGVLDAAYGPASQSIIDLTQDRYHAESEEPATTISVPSRMHPIPRCTIASSVPQAPKTNAFDIMRRSQPTTTQSSQPSARPVASFRPKARSDLQAVTMATIKTAEMRARQRKKKYKPKTLSKQPSEDWTDGESTLLAKFMRDKKWTSAKCAAALGTGRSDSSVRNRRAWIKTHHPEWLLSSPRASQQTSTRAQATLFGSSAVENNAPAAPSRGPPPNSRLPRVNDRGEEAATGKTLDIDCIYDSVNKATHIVEYTAKDLLVHRPLCNAGRNYTNPPDMWDTDEAREIGAILDANSRKKHTGKPARTGTMARFRRSIMQAPANTTTRVRSLAAVVLPPRELASEEAVEPVDSASTQPAVSDAVEVEDAGSAQADSEPSLSVVADEEADEVITTFHAQKASSQSDEPDNSQLEGRSLAEADDENATRAVLPDATVAIGDAVSLQIQLIVPPQSSQSMIFAQMTRIAPLDCVENGTMTLEDVCEEADQLDAYAEYMSNLLTLSELYDCIKGAFRNWPGRQPFRQKGISYYLEDLIVPSEGVRDQESVLVLSALEPSILPREHPAFGRQHLRHCLVEGLAVVMDNTYAGMTKTQVNDVCDMVFGFGSVHCTFARAFTVKALNLSQEESTELRAIRHFQLGLMFEDYLWMHWRPAIFLPESRVCPPENAFSPWPDERPDTEIMPGTVLREMEQVILDVYAAIDQQPRSANTRSSKRKQKNRQDADLMARGDSGLGTSTSPDRGAAHQADIYSEDTDCMVTNHVGEDPSPTCPAKQLLDGVRAYSDSAPLKAKTEATHEENEEGSLQCEMVILDCGAEMLNHHSPIKPSITMTEYDTPRRLSTTSVPADLPLLTSEASRETARSTDARRRSRAGHSQRRRHRQAERRRADAQAQAHAQASDATSTATFHTAVS